MAAAARAETNRMLHSSVQFALAFQLVFLVHELGLVVAARLMGAEQATLFHNNMAFRMTDPVQTLAFGIGPLATLVTGLLAAALFAALPAGAVAWRRFLLWTAGHGAIMCLGQAPSVAHNAEGDLGKAVHYLDWPPLAYRLFGIAGLLGLVAVGLWVGHTYLAALVPGTVDLSTGRRRLRSLANGILGPLLLGALLCVPFRVPPLDRALLPLTTIAGFGWAALAIWWPPAARRPEAALDERIGWGWIAALAALLVFTRVLLVPGVPIG